MNSDYKRKLREILDAHAEYYIRQTVKFFQEKADSTALSKDNEGDLVAESAINALVLEVVNTVIGEDLQIEPYNPDDTPVQSLIWQEKRREVKVQNQLRAEARQKAKELINPGEEKE